MVLLNDPYKQPPLGHKQAKPQKQISTKVIMGVIFGIILVLAVAGVIYGNWTHEEPGFTTPANAWSHVPLTVSCAGYVGAEDDACDVVVSVVDVINSRLGFDMLELDYSQAEPTIADIHVTMRAPVEVGSDGPCGTPGECFELTGTGTMYTYCSMRTMNASGGASDLEWLVVYHGLGHCLGLAHDTYDQSIMRSVQYATPARTIPPWISDWDKKLIRERYMVE